MSCNKNEFPELDAEVIVIRTYRSNDLGGSANVRYSVKNTSNEIINGWNIYFRVSMNSGQQIDATDGLTYILEPEETSKTLIATGKLPSYFKNEDEPASASLKFIEVY